MPISAINKVMLSCMSQNTIDEHFIKLCDRYSSTFDEEKLPSIMEEIEYVLTSEDLPYLADVRYKNNIALRTACSFNSLELVKFLLTSPVLQVHAQAIDLDANRIDVFTETYMNFKKLRHPSNEAQNLVDYLIYDYKIESNEHIISTLESFGIDDLEQILTKRDLLNHLNTQLNDKDVKSNKIKI